MPKVTVNVPSILEQKLLGTPITREMSLSRAELRTLFYVGRKLRLINCYLGPTSKDRVVAAHRSWGYELTTPEGNTSTLRFETGNKISGVTAGNGYYEVKIHDADGKLAAHYELLIG